MQPSIGRPRAQGLLPGNPDGFGAVLQLNLALDTVSG
jgi:hypothetical protein